MSHSAPIAARICRRSATALFALLLAGTPATVAAQAIITVTGFGPASWGASDATLGIAGFVMEDFEDTTLTPGLSIGWETPAGNTPPAATLPFTFNPVTQDPFGTAFHTGVWDGSLVLVNTRTNQSYVYANVANWGDIVLTFSTPVTSVGFSLQQNDFDVGLVVNGTNVGSVQSFTGLVPNGSRYGYLRIDAVAGQSISSLQLANGRFAFNDGFVLDHLAFMPIPEPSGFVLLFLGAGVCSLWYRFRVRHAGTRNPVGSISSGLE